MHTPWAIVVWDRSSHDTSKPKPAATTCPALQSYIRMFPLHTYVPKPLQQAASRARRPPWPAPSSPGLEAHHEHSSRLPTRSRARHMRGSNDAAPLSRTTEAAVLHATARVSFPGPARQPQQGKRNRLLLRRMPSPSFSRPYLHSSLFPSLFPAFRSLHRARWTRATNRSHRMPLRDESMDQARAGAPRRESRASALTTRRRDRASALMPAPSFENLPRLATYPRYGWTPRTPRRGRR
jgi:hypothetical protein